MANYKVLGTDHTAYTVSDMDRSVKMFCEVLGFQLVSDDRAGADIVEALNRDRGACEVRLSSRTR